MHARHATNTKSEIRSPGRRRGEPPDPEEGSHNVDKFGVPTAHQKHPQRLTYDMRKARPPVREKNCARHENPCVKNALDFCFTSYFTTSIFHAVFTHLSTHLFTHLFTPLFTPVFTPFFTPVSSGAEGDPANHLHLLDVLAKLKPGGRQRTQGKLRKPSAHKTHSIGPRGPTRRTKTLEPY